MAKVFMVLVWIILILPILIGMIANADHWFSFVFIALSSLCFVSMLRPIPKLKLDKPLKGFVAGTVILLAGAIADVSWNAESLTTASNGSCEFGEAHAGRYYVLQSKINFRKGPGTEYDKVLNEKATALLKSPDYRTLSYNMELAATCKSGNWIKGRIVKADGERVDWETGWVLSKFISTSKPEAQKQGLLVDFSTYSGLTPQEQQTLTKGALKVLKEDPACASIDDGYKSTVTKGSFYVTCNGRGSKEGRSFNVTFTGK